MDLVGPLPKSAKGHKYIIVIVDYATRYPEAMPLWKATSRNNARELVLLFTQVVIPKEIITDQGVQVNDLSMSSAAGPLPTHISVPPQKDCLGERYNQTLKRMLWKVVKREAVIGTYFFPMYYIDVVREDWESQP